jgi:exosome complex RNA-binding protein Csl4
MTIDEQIHDLHNEFIKLQIEMQKFLKETNEKAKNIYQGVEILRAKVLSLAKKDEFEDN